MRFISFGIMGLIIMPGSEEKLMNVPECRQVADWIKVLRCPQGG